jgi:2-dehydropantoate 2-reductase
MSEVLRIMSIGAGAIGTYIGGSLALDGHEVMFVERPEMAEQLRTRGLKLNLSGADQQLPQPQIAGSIEEALESGAFDVALFSLKSFDTGSFLASLRVPAESMPPILCLSNGVDNETMISAVLGPGRVIAGTVTSAIGVRGAGDIALEKLRGVGVALPGDDSGAVERELCELLVEAMDAAGLNARLFQSAADMKWSKMFTNLIANASSAILDRSPAEIFAHHGLYRLEIEQLRETLRVMAAQDIRIIDLPGTPVRLLAFVVKYLPLPLSRPLLAKAIGGGRGGKMPSFHIDLHGGRGQSEVGFLNGAVMQAGERTGIPTPVNELLYEKLRALTRGDIPLDHYRKRPEKLIGDLG